MEQKSNTTGSKRRRRRGRKPDAFQANFASSKRRRRSSRKKQKAIGELGTVETALQSVSDATAKITKPISSRFSGQFESVRRNWWVQFVMGVGSGILLLASIFAAFYFLFT